MPDIFTDEQSTPMDSQKNKKLSFSPMHFFSTLIHKPQGISFAEQEDDEQVILFVRRDFITNVPWLFLSFIFSLIPLILPSLFAASGIPLSFLPNRVLIIMNVFYYSVVFGFALSKFISWFYGIGIVTTRRAIDIDLYNVSYINVAATGLKDLKNAQYVQRGFFQSLFDYGDVELTVEAAGKELVFEQIPQPARVVNIISGLIGEK